MLQRLALAARRLGAPRLDSPDEAVMLRLPIRTTGSVRHFARKGFGHWRPAVQFLTGPHRGAFFVEEAWTVLRLGILFSTSGDYGVLGRDCRDGAMTAIEELRRTCSIAIEPVFGDPAGSSERYIELARKMLLEDQCRHLIGTVTSQARKDVIPVVEKHDALLWYVCPYEGFEANPNVIYTGACPNQHLLPLFEHMLPFYGKRVYLTGANYIWGWEMNRLAREIVTEAGGEIVGERCLADRRYRRRAYHR